MPEIPTSDIEFTADGKPSHAFLAAPAGSGSFPGVIVIQEWWGLDAHIKDVAQRFAREGFIALAPDLYHGDVAAEPAAAQKLMMALDMNRASRELVSATDHLAADSRLAGRGIASIGFCMGGGLALTLACDSPHIRATAPFYGMNPNPIDKIANLRGPVLAVYAERDNFAGPAVRDALEAALKQHGKAGEIRTYPGTQHAFFNDTRADVYNQSAATDAWGRVLTLFHQNL